ncbi:MAG TPA: histidine phosphatase family protein [Acidimicrobiia bacterium]|nr:histidine phosphatase family protein [Acidimicrobiia bacterium]
MLHLVRHGRTDANAQGLLLGRADPPLSEEGRRQANALASMIPVEARVVASPLRRTRETAEAFGRPLELDERWIELDYGELDGTPLRDVPADLWREWRANPMFVPPGGESLTSLGVRVRAACAELAEEVRERDVVVVSHVSPIKAAIAWALDTGDELSWRLFVHVASVARIGVDQWGATLRSLNELPVR